MRKNWIVCIALILLIGTGSAYGQKKDENSYIKVPNVRYATHVKSDPKLNMLNVYMPKKGSNSPMIVWIHGGAWALGDKDNVLYKAEFFTSRGYVFVSVNYRLSPQVKHPAHVQDIADALVWLRDNATHYSADAGKMFLAGHSAGAHLAALVSIDQKYLEKSGASPSMLSGVVLLDGAGYDIPLLMKDASSKLKESYELAFGKSKKDWEQASPVNFIEAGKETPPFLIAYAGEREASEKEAIILSKKLSEVHVENKVFHYEKKNHFTINRELGKERDKPTEDVYRFLQEIHYNAVNPIK